jgi:hypothetical protein
MIIYNNKYIRCSNIKKLKKIEIIRGEDILISEIPIDEIKMPNVLISLVEREEKDYINMMSSIRILVTNKRGMRNWREIPENVENIVITELYDNKNITELKEEMIYRDRKPRNKIIRKIDIDMIEYMEEEDKKNVIRGYIERDEIEKEDSEGRNILEIAIENGMKEESKEIIKRTEKGKIKRGIMEYIVKHKMDEVGEEIIDKMEEEEIKNIERIRYYMSYGIYGTMIKIMRIKKNKEDIEYLKYMIKMYEDDKEKKEKWIRECEEMKK